MLASVVGGPQFDPRSGQKVLSIFLPVTFVCWEAGVILRLKNAIIKFAFLEMLFTCLLQEMLLRTVTAWFFEFVFVASFLPFMTHLEMRLYGDLPVMTRCPMAIITFL